MIAGETEHILGLTYEPAYDSFFRKRLKDEPSDDEASDKSWWERQQDKYENSDGIPGIAETIGNIGGLFKKGDKEEVTTSALNAEEDKKKLHTGVWIVGGVVLVTVVIFTLTSLNVKPTAE